MNIFKSSLFIAFIAVSCFLFGNETMNAQDKIVNGYSVNYLDFGQRGKKLGVYEQIGDKKWREVGTSKFNFAETHRDEWSVYLIDKSRNVNIQLDLHRKEVIYSAGKTKKTPIYTIMKTSSKVNGWLVKELIYGNNAGAKLGYFIEQEGKKWQEVSVKDGKHNFVETHRDQWSVYLIDKPRNVSIQLDLHTKKVMYAIGNQKKNPLYTIVETSSKLNSLKMPQSTKPAVKPIAKPTFATIDHNATYQIIPAYNNLALDIPGSSKANGAKLHQWANHGGINQQFRLEPKGNGYYVIVNVNSGRALDIPRGSKADGVQLVQWDKHGGANQQFGFEKAGADTYIIFNRNSGKVLDVYGGSRDNGGKITQFTKHGRENQRFKLVKVIAKPKPVQPTSTVVNGYSVNYLDFGQQGRKLGVYEQIGDKKWREVGSPSRRGGKTSTFNFVETQRDEWSVYLTDKSRNVNIQLDLHRKEVIYSDSKTKRSPIYTIMKTSSKMNGWLAKEVTYNRGSVKGGTFVQQSGKNWQEISVKDGKHNFVETHRDQWSVYLIDKPRNVSIQLDLHTKKVMYAIGNQKKTPLYSIAGAK